MKLTVEGGATHTDIGRQGIDVVFFVAEMTLYCFDGTTKEFLVDLIECYSLDFDILAFQEILIALAAQFQQMADAQLQHLHVERL